MNNEIYTTRYLYCKMEAASNVIHFRNMTPDEFSEFAQWSIGNYANELIESGNISLQSGLLEAKKEYNEMLPDGHYSKDNYLYVIENEHNENVGAIWYQKHLQKLETAFICEFVIKKEFRQRGYGRSALEEIIKDAKAKGYSKMGLNVFKFNSIAYFLYLKCEFKVIEDYEGNVIMEKAI